MQMQRYFIKGIPILLVTLQFQIKLQVRNQLTFDIFDWETQDCLWKQITSKNIKDFKYDWNGCQWFIKISVTRNCVDDKVS